MIRNLLIGLDGSAFSEATVELGIRWARRTGAELTGLAVVDEPTICRPEPVPLGSTIYKAQRDAALLQDAGRKVARFLQRFARQCAAAGVKYRVLREVGLPSSEILDEAEDFDLTLLGKQTYYHFETQDSADETLHAVLRGSHRPVVAVPAELPASAVVVVAYDGSPPATRALEAFQRSGLYAGQDVVVLSVAPDGGAAARHAEEGARYLRFHGIAAAARPLTASGAADRLLLEQINELDAGLVVMGAHGGSPLWGFLFGSTTRAIVERSSAVVFLHH